MSVLQLPVSARAVLGAVISLASVAVIWALSAANYATLTPDQLVSIAFLFALYLLADANVIPLNFPSSTVSITVSTAIDVALVLLYGPTVALPFVMLAVVITEVLTRRPPIKFIFNVSAAVLSTAAASLAFSTFGRVGESPLADGWQVLAWLLAAAAHVAANVTLLSLIISTTSRTPFLPLWREISGAAEMQQWTQPPLGALIAVLQLHSPWALVLAILPLLAIYLSYRRFLELKQQTRTVVETLADALDQRDAITAQHSRRVTQYVQRTLDELSALPISETDMIVAAARIHDLGKVAISDACLHKNGPLNDAERLEMNRHPVIGAELLQPLSMYQMALAIVRHHHERWDGRGYPDGLVGERIPFGARVLAVADSFDAMTSDRPYRRAMSVERALAEIEAGRGTQFDPAVVDAFRRAMGAAEPVHRTRYGIAGAE
ncbi:MAG: HD-GYP domain-containing protein [Chloroflexi bacterium]|nr:HD-GYP domain-containing protein [Chloroflexota bacterium]